MHYFVTQGDETREYRHIGRDVRDANCIALINSDGELEIWAVDPDENWFAEILRYYRDAFGWPDSFTALIGVFKRVQ